MEKVVVVSASGVPPSSVYKLIIPLAEDETGRSADSDWCALLLR